MRPNSLGAPMLIFGLAVLVSVRSSQAFGLLIGRGDESAKQEDVRALLIHDGETQRLVCEFYFSNAGNSLACVFPVPTDARLRIGGGRALRLAEDLGPHWGSTWIMSTRCGPEAPGAAIDSEISSEPLDLAALRRWLADRRFEVDAPLGSRLDSLTAVGMKFFPIEVSPRFRIRTRLGPQRFQLPALTFQWRSEAPSVPTPPWTRSSSIYSSYNVCLVSDVALYPDVERAKGHLLGSVTASMFHNDSIWPWEPDHTAFASRAWGHSESMEAETQLTFHR